MWRGSVLLGHGDIHIMLRAIFVLLTLMMCGLAVAQETTVLPTDKYGHVQHNKPSYTVESDGRIVVTNPYGNKQYHKPGFKFEGNRIYQTNAYGQIKHNKPSYTE